MWSDKLVFKDFIIDPFLRKANVNTHTDYASNILYSKQSKKLPLPRDIERETGRIYPFSSLEYANYTLPKTEYQGIKSITKRNSQEYFHGKCSSTTIVYNYLRNFSQKSKFKHPFYDSKLTEKFCVWNTDPQICPKISYILLNDNSLKHLNYRETYQEYIIIEKLSKTLKSKFNRRSWKQRSCINRDYRSAYNNYYINNTSTSDCISVKHIKEDKSNCYTNNSVINVQSSYNSINDKELTLWRSKPTTIDFNKHAYNQEMSDNHADLYNQESIRCLNIKKKNCLESKHSKVSNEIKQSSDFNIRVKNINYEKENKINTKICCKCSDNKIYIQPTRPTVSSYSAVSCPNQTKYCNDLCETPGNCLKQKSTEESSKDNNTQAKEKLYCLKVIKTDKDQSNSSLSLKSNHSVNKLGEQKTNSRKYLNSCPCKSSCEAPKHLGSSSECPQSLNKKANTFWDNCLAKFLGFGKFNKNAETSTANNIENYMDSKSSDEKCFNNPNKIKSPIASKVCIVDVKSCELNESDSKASITSRRKCNSSPSKRIIIIQEKESKCVLKAPENVEIYQSNANANKIPCSCEKTVPKIQSPKCSDKDNERLQALLDSHCQAMATIKCALQDIACKAYYGTSEVASAAATFIQTEGAKQLEKIKNFKLPDDEVTCRPSRTPCKKCRPKDCSNEEESENSTVFSHKISNIEIKQDEDDKVSLPKVIVNKIAEKVESAVSLVKENFNFNISDFLPNSLNDDSSEYDVPDEKFLKKKPQDVSNVMINNDTSTSGSAMFKNFASKFTLMFDKSDAICNEKADAKSNENREQIEDQNQPREDNSTSSIPEATMKQDTDKIQV